MSSLVKQADSRCSNLKQEVTEHVQFLGHSLGRLESGISSIQTTSEVILDATLDTRDQIGSVARMMTKIDRTVQSLRRDLPSLLEPTIVQCLEKRLKGELENILAGSVALKPPTNDNQSHVVSGGEQWVLDVNKPSKSLGKGSYSTPQAKIVGDKFRFPQPTRASVRNKTYLKSFTLPFGFVQSRTIQRKSHAPSANGVITEKELLRVEITILPFSWLSSRGQVVSIEKVYNHHSQSLWTYSPRTYNIRSENAMVVAACRNQDLDTVKRLFEYREASPFDVDTEGRPLLALALGHTSGVQSLELSIQLIKYLISEGADPTALVPYFLQHYVHFGCDTWIVDSLFDYVPVEGFRTSELFNEIWRLCLQSCRSDPFIDIRILENFWDISLGGQISPPLDPAYLFQDQFTGFEDLLFENPDKIFSDLMEDRNCLGSGALNTWKGITDQLYETLVYVCQGGSESHKAKIFSKPYSDTVPKLQKDSCFCPTIPSHLLFKLFHKTQDDRELRLAHLDCHLHRMSVLLLQSGEDPEARCACKTSWQDASAPRSVTEVAISNGHLDIWEKALEETGHDATRITDEFRYFGIAEMFEPPCRKPNPLIAPLKAVVSVVSLIV